MIEWLIAFAWYSFLFAGWSIICSLAFVGMCIVGRLLPDKWL